MSHTITYMVIAPRDQHAARCRCGWRSNLNPAKQGAEDQVFAHLNQVNRVRAHLGGRSPSLASQRNHYREMASDPIQSPSEQAMWGRLADELDKRLNDTSPPVEQPQLPFS